MTINKKQFFYNSNKLNINNNSLLNINILIYRGSYKFMNNKEIQLETFIQIYLYYNKKIFTKYLFKIRNLFFLKNMQ